MQSAVDFGKDFLTQYYNKRDADACVAFLAEDIIWVTPGEILHLKSTKAVHDFLFSSMRDDETAYNVDIAQIMSAPNLESTNIITYEVNLIPKHKESSVSLRCTLALHEHDGEFEIVYIGMSRPYMQTDVEQIRTFADALPAGIMTLCRAQKENRLMYANAYFASRLGYSDAVFFEKAESNPFFMMPYEEQKRMITLVSEMAALSKPKPLSMQVTLLHSENEQKIPCHMTISVAYKDTKQTVLYLIFDEITDLLKEYERRKKKEERARKAKEAAGETSEPQKEPVPAMKAQPAAVKEADSEDVNRRIEEIRRDAEKQIATIQIAANVRIEEAMKLAKDEADAAENLIRVKLEQAHKDQQEAVEEAKREVANLYSAAWKEEKKKHTDEKKALQDELIKTQQIFDEMTKENETLKERLKDLEEGRAKRDHAYEDRILKLEWAANKQEERAKEKLEALRKELKEESDQALAREEEKKQAQIQALQKEFEEKSAGDKAKSEELSAVIARQAKDLQQKEMILQKKDVDRKNISKEKEKSIRRMESLLQGQMQSVRSIASSAQTEKNPAELRKKMTKIADISREIQDLSADLSAISNMNPAQRKKREDPFTISSCLNLVRGVIKPQCREKGIIFSVEKEPDLPDQVTGNKAGLELSCLCILENAVENTLRGGRILLKASAEPPVRGSAYFHFLITDTGQGIPEDRLPVLFDNPESELSIARKIVGTMGGSIQVRSKAGEGSSFEIRVSLKLSKS